MSRRDEDESHNFGACVVIAETNKAIGVARPKDSGEDEFEEVERHGRDLSAKSWRVSWQGADRRSRPLVPGGVLAGRTPGQE